MDQVIKLNDGRVARIFEARNGQLTLKVNEIFIHSRYDPYKEALVFVEYHKAVYQGQKSVVACGLGLGYSTKELLKRIDPNCLVYLYEPDEALLKVTKTLKMVQEVLSDPRIKLIEGYNPYSLNEFAKRLSLTGDFLLYKPSLRVLPTTYTDLQDALFDFELGKIGIGRFGNLLVENNELNLMLDYRRIEEFLEAHSNEIKPVVIVSSGPSLDSTIPELIKYRDRFRLFCAGSALRTLMKYDIHPDMICIIDAHDIVAKQFRDFENLEIPLCFLNTASHQAVVNYQGPKYIFYNEATHGNIIIETGRSVATALLSIALKSEAAPIIFVGQDLAFIDNKHHTETYTEIYGESNDASLHSHFETVLGVSGKMLYTNSGLLSFKRWIERTIANNPQVTFINASKGAKITGTVEKDIGELFK